MSWAQWLIIPSRISLAASSVILLHILISFFSGYLEIKPFHLFTLLMCVIDLLQDTPYSIPADCSISTAFFLFGCISKTLIAATFVGYMNHRMSYSVVAREVFLRQFLYIGIISFIFPAISIFLMVNQTGNFHDICDGDGFDANLESPIAHSTRGIMFFFAVETVPTIGYSIFVYSSFSIIRKVGFDVFWKVDPMMGCRFILSQCIFTIGVAPCLFMAILFLSNDHSGRKYTIFMKLVGLCNGLQGFYYFIFYFLEIPLKAVQCILKTNDKSRDNTPPTFGQLVHQPTWSEPIVTLSNFRSSFAPPLSQVTLPRLYPRESEMMKTLLRQSNGQQH